MSQYVAIYSNEAVGVYTNYDALQESLKYIKGGVNQAGFDNYYTACRYAISQYNALQDPCCPERFFEINKNLAYNRTYYGYIQAMSIDGWAEMKGWGEEKSFFHQKGSEEGVKGVMQYRTQEQQ